MHESYLGDRDITKFDIYYMSGPAVASRHRGHRMPDDPGFSRRVFKWGSLPEALDRPKVLKLCLEHEDSSIVELPEVVHELPNLIALSIPGRFLKQLRPGAIPPSVRTLGIWEDKTVTLPAAIHLPGLADLQTLGEGVVKFRAEQIPDVRKLIVRLDRAGVVLREVERVEKLEVLMAGPISNPEILERLASRPLRFFRTANGGVDTIEPLRGCPTMTNLWLAGLGKLTSLAPLLELPDLRELSISYCPRLRLDPSFLELRSLRKLFLFANRDIGVAAIRPGLEALNLEDLTISGTR